MIDLKELKKTTERFIILFVEDDEALLQRTTPLFERFFKRVDTASNGKIGLEKYSEYKDDTNHYYDIVISDIQMPIMNGIELSRSILKINPEQKIIITSAYNDKEYLIDLINIGVAGFFQKPIDNKNMFRVLYDVSMSLIGENKIELGDGFSYDTTNKTLFSENVIVELSKQEQKLLDLLCRNPNQYFTPIDIFNHIYYDQVEKEFSSDSIKSLIKRLRKKISSEMISNIPNQGYRIKLPD